MNADLPGVDRAAAAFVHPTSLAYGHVNVGEGSSLWPYSVIRAESAHVRIGRFVNVQDFVMIHTSPGLPVEIGDYTSITHHSTIHGTRIGARCLIGINATLYDGTVVGDNCIIGQHAYLKDGTQVPDNSIVVGAPAKIIRTHNSALQNTLNALLYHRNALAFARGDHRAWDGPDFERWVMETMERLQKEFSAEISVSHG
jgi:carbonic anhydrase/acetyltransferase-like protein (isoleucine patch superfamily)